MAENRLLKIISSFYPIHVAQKMLALFVQPDVSNR
jgi:hypothetical protein